METQFPYNVEFDNYKVQINKPKLFNHYVLFDYNVETKDGSPIEEGDFNITGSVKFPDKAYFISSDNILNEINNNKMHIVDVGIIVARENYDLYVKNPSFLVNAREKGSSKLIYEEKRIDKRIETKGIIYPTKENYKEINKTFKLDNIDFNILSLGNFDFGSFIPIFIGNISHEQSEEISNKYAIRIKCGNLNQIYNLEKWAGFYEKAIKNYSKIDSKYNKNSEYDQFYMAKILYNPNEVSRDNMEIYLINKNTNEEVKIN
ncbi:hypothetical protein P5F47_14815 [Clostridium perfringens]|nr:hypothetical protein [Clostridium perfringens]MDK0954753.1 hypothetical protein [Clostridium perfringens]